MPAKPSKVLDNKNETDILFPKPTPFIWNGKEYPIKPMPDRVLMTLTEELGRVMQLLDSLREVGAISEPMEIMQYVPDIVKILLPNATRIIAGSLRVDEEEVAENMFLGQKAEALCLIVEAEDLPLLVANFTRLTGMFNPPQAKPEMNTGQN